MACVRTAPTRLAARKRMARALSNRGLDLRIGLRIALQSSQSEREQRPAGKHRRYHADQPTNGPALTPRGRRRLDDGDRGKVTRFVEACTFVLRADSQVSRFQHAHFAFEPSLLLQEQRRLRVRSVVLVESG